MRERFSVSVVTRHVCYLTLSPPVEWNGVACTYCTEPLSESSDGVGSSSVHRANGLLAKTSPGIPVVIPVPWQMLHKLGFDFTTLRSLLYSIFCVVQ